jgi:hypothetical protein
MTQREKLTKTKMSLLGNWPPKSGWLTERGYSN